MPPVQPPSVSQAPAQTPSTQLNSGVPAPVLFPNNPNTFVKDAEGLLHSLEKNWKSPAFWVHAAVQALAWVSYFQANTNSLKYGALSLSGGALLSYLLHLVGISQKS